MKNVEGLIPIKTVTDLMAAAEAKLSGEGFKITNRRAGGVFNTLLEIGFQGLEDLYTLLQEVISQVYVTSATGDWLDIKAAELEVYRRLATKAQGKVIFSRDVTDGNVIIPAGAVVSTPVDAKGNSYRYLVTNQAVLETGVSSIAVPVEAEFTGDEYNVGVGQITNFITFISGIDQVTNNADWLEQPGTNDEDDETLRARARQKWHQFSTGGTREAYISWSQEIPGVVVVQVDDEHPRGQGSIDVIITSTAGIPTSELIAKVQSHIDFRKPLCANVLVVAPTPVTVDWDITLLVNNEYGVLADIEAQGTEIIDIMFRYGDDSYPDVKKLSPTLGVIRAQAISNLMAIEYVENVIINSPAADVLVSSRQLAVKGNVSITAVRLS